MRLSGIILAVATLAGCGGDPIEQKILGMETVSEVGRACYRDAGQIRFEHSENCEELAAAISPEKIRAPTGASQEQAARFAAAVFNAERMLWQAYATSLDRTTYEPTSSVYDKLTNRVRSPQWLREQRKKCLNERRAAECSSVPTTPLPL